MVEAWLELTLDFCCLETESLNMTNTSSLFENSGLFVLWHWDWSCIFDWPFWEEFWREIQRVIPEETQALHWPEAQSGQETSRCPSSFPIPVLDQSQTHLQCLPLGSGNLHWGLIINHLYLWSVKWAWPGPSQSLLFVFRCSNHSCQWSSFSLYGK